MTNEHLLPGHRANPKRSLKRPRVVKGVHNDVACITYGYVVHFIRNVIEIKKVSEKISRHSELGKATMRITHGHEQSRVKSIVCIILLNGRMVSVEKPLFWLWGYILSMSTHSQAETVTAVRRKIWNGDTGLVHRTVDCVELWWYLG